MLLKAGEQARETATGFAKLVMGPGLASRCRNLYKSGRTQSDGEDGRCSPHTLCTTHVASCPFQSVFVNSPGDWCHEVSQWVGPSGLKRTHFLSSANGYGLDPLGLLGSPETERKRRSGSIGGPLPLSLGQDSLQETHIYVQPKGKKMLGFLFSSLPLNSWH